MRNLESDTYFDPVQSLTIGNNRGDGGNNSNKSSNGSA